MGLWFWYAVMGGVLWALVLIALVLAFGYGWLAI